MTQLLKNQKKDIRTDTSSLKVSVIIPLYNQKEYVSDAVNSVLTQSYNNLEIIIIDDHSQDSSLDVALKLKRDNQGIIKVLNNEKNCGVSFTRNRGVNNANGNFIAFLDADDFWFPLKIEKQVNLLKNDPEVSLVHTGVITVASEADKKWLKIGNDKTVLSIDHWNRAFCTFCKKAESFSGADYFFELLKANGICNSSVMVKKDVLEWAGGFTQGLPYQVEDWLLWLKIAMISRIATIEDRLTGYRFHARSHTARYFINKEFDFSEVRNLLMAQCKEYDPVIFEKHMAKAQTG